MPTRYSKNIVFSSLNYRLMFTPKKKILDADMLPSGSCITFYSRYPAKKPVAQNGPTYTHYHKTHKAGL